MMKPKGCAVYIENKKGDFYLVALTKEQEACVVNLLGQLHEGQINVFKDKAGLERVKPQKCETKKI